MKRNNRDHFYKYVTADIAKKILTDLKVKLSSPFSFNDPFDSQIPISVNYGEIENLHEIVYSQFLDLSGPFKERIDRNQLFKDAKKDIGFLLNEFTDFESVMDQEIKQRSSNDTIFCVSEQKNDLLMWAHYADEHKGAVIKLKCMPEKDTALCAAQKVDYSLNMPTIDVKTFIKGGLLDPESLAQKILAKVFLTKSRHWRYEKEWRVIFFMQKNEPQYNFMKIGEEEIDAIYLGCKMDDNDKKDILNIIENKRKKVSIFEAKKNNKQFKLDFQRFNQA